MRLEGRVLPRFGDPLLLASKYCCSFSDNYLGDPNSSTLVRTRWSRSGSSVLNSVSRVLPSCKRCLPRPSLVLQEKEMMNYKGETEGMPLFTSSTLNIRRIEVEYRGFSV